MCRIFGVITIVSSVYPEKICNETKLPRLVVFENKKARSFGDPASIN